MRGVFLEIAPPERSVASELFDDPWYSGEAIVTTVLTEHGGKTTLTTTIRYESQKVRDSVLKSHTTAGVGMSYDRLAEVLGSIAAETLSKEAG